MVCSLPGSLVHRISQVRILERIAISFSRDLPTSGIELGNRGRGRAGLQYSGGPGSAAKPLCFCSSEPLFGIMGPELLPCRDTVGTGHGHSSATERGLNYVLRKDASGLGRWLAAPPGSGWYLILCSAGAGRGVQPTSSLEGTLRALPAFQAV